MGIFRKKEPKSRSPNKRSIFYWHGGERFDLNDCVSEFPIGFRRLCDCPEVRIAVHRIADLLSSQTIYLLENTDKGDRRIVNGLAKKIDISPNSNMIRKNFIYHIVSAAILSGDGNMIVYPKFKSDSSAESGYYLKNLIPLDMEHVSFPVVDQTEETYSIEYKQKRYAPDEVLHFVIKPSDKYPYIGAGYARELIGVIRNLSQAAITKNRFLKSDYIPRLLIKVDANVDEFASSEAQEKIVEKYLGGAKSGAPFIIPSDLFEVEQVKPLSLADLAINDTVNLDKKTIAAAFGVPAFMVGAGDFNKEEYENFITSVIMPMSQIIAQELTRKLLVSPNLYFKFNPRSLYNYDLGTLASVGTEMVSIGAMMRSELRDWLNLSLQDDESLYEFSMLENYIPSSMIGEQAKLKGGDKKDE